MSKLVPSFALVAAALLAGCPQPAEVDCMPGWTLCGGTCLTLDSDALNCGACGKACPQDESCVAGACAADCTKQLHAATPDPWGLTWDGLERPAASHAAARAACEAIGGRLPSLSELYRVGATRTGAVGDSYRTNVLWALTPSSDLSHMAIKLSDGVTSERSNATPTNYRCVCAPPKPAAFTGGACQGAPGAECFTFSGDPILSYDASDRPLATKAAAIWDCAFSGGQLATPERLGAAIQAGLPNGSGVELHTGDQESNVNGVSVYWTTATWGASTGIEWVAPSTLSPFRCAGARNEGTTSAAPAIGSVLASRTGMVAESSDRASVPYASAVNTCFRAGGHLPTASELAAVAMQGLSRVGGAGFLWTGDEVGPCPAYSAATYQWADIAEWPGVTGATIPGLGFTNATWIASSVKTGTLPFRCIYYPTDPAYVGPASCNGGCKRYDLADGRAAGAAARIWIDSQERGPATYSAASNACAGLGGRLASARDLVEGIKNGLPGIPSGTPASVLTSDVGCSTASIYAIPQWLGSSNDSYQDDLGTVVARTTSALYRCIWTNEIR